MTYLAVDTETTGLSVWKGARPFAISYCWDYEHAYKQEYIEFPVDIKTREVKYDYCKLMQFCMPLFDPKIEKIFHNAKFDLRMLEFEGINVQGTVHDTYFAARCCYTDEESNELKDLAKKYLNISNQDEIDLRKQVSKYKKSYNLNIEEAYWLPNALGAKDNLLKKYCMLDAYRTMKLWQFYLEGMKELGVYHSYLKELELMPIVYDMEDRGIRFNKSNAQKEFFKCYEEALVLGGQLKEELGVNNLNSSIQLKESLYSTSRMGLPIHKYTDKGNASTSVETLKKLDKNATIERLLMYRANETATRYIKQYIYYAVEDDNLTWSDYFNWKPLCIHAGLNQFGAKTNRFTCSHPNLLNVSEDKTSSGEFVVNLRQFFYPREGYLWITLDRKQLELRIFADRAKENVMLAAFAAGRDIHDETRRKVPMLAALPEKKGRKIAKNTNFLKIFCGGAKTLNEKYGVPYDEAVILLKEYDYTFPAIRKYANYLSAIAKADGFIVNAFDRKIYVPEDKAYRSVSYDIQGSAADLMKVDLIKIDRYLKKTKLDAHLLLTIYDEIIIEVRKKHFSLDLVKNIKDIMEDHEGAFNIDLPVDTSIVVDNWSNKCELSFT